MTDSNIIIKKLKAEDIELLLSLRMEVLSNVFSLEKEKISDKEWEEIRKENKKYYSEEIKDENHIACALFVSGQLAGCGGVCFYRELPSPDNRSGKCAYIMNVYVRKEYRRQGLAKKICRFLIEKSQKKGAEKIYLESSDMAVKLYKNLGFADMNGYMKL
nr:GNAT family N-acetyltransferase [Lachnospiraceae bacterium]